MNKGKKLCALCLACLFLLFGCSSKNEMFVDSDPNGDITTITMFGNKYESENVTVIEEIISGFMEENAGIRVSYESLKGSDYFTALEKRLAAGKGDDVFMVNHDVLLELNAKGQVADLTELAEAAGYSEQMLDQMKDNGRVSWLPTSVSAFGLYCNLDLLKKYGQEVPNTLPEWKQVCDVFLGEGITPIVANNDISLKTLAIGAGFFSVYQEGRAETVFQRLNSGEEALSQYLSSGFALVKEFIDLGYVDSEKALTTQKTSDDLEQFAEGESPFLLTGAWAAGRVKGMDPGFSFEVAPLPVLEEGSLLVMNADTRLSVNADSLHSEEAMKFVEYFIRPENVEKFASQQCSFSPLLQAGNSLPEELQPLLSCYEAGRTVIGTDGKLELPIWNLTAEASQKLLSGEALDQVMGWIDEQSAAEGRVQE